jgi:hypothetical protein
MRLCTLCVSLALMLFVLPGLQSGQQPIDGAQAVLADPLLDKMVGHWTMNGKLMGRPTIHTVEAKWVLNHQFLEIHEWGPPDPKTGKPQYEAMPMIGYDNMSERYVAHRGILLRHLPMPLAASRVPDKICTERTIGIFEEKIDLITYTLAISQRFRKTL